MYPTLSDFFREVLGINIPLPVQSYGFMVALAFITGAIILAAEFKRKEKEGYFLPLYKTIKEGQPASVTAITISFLIGFIIGFKLVEGIFHYMDFVDNPQEFILSAKGNWPGGIIFGSLSAFYTWWDKHRKRLDTPRDVEKQIHPYQLAGNVLVIAGVAGIIGAKLFHNLENLDAFIQDPVGELLSFSGLTFLGGLIVGFAAVAYYLKKNNISLLHAMDAAALAIPLAYGIGRIGCQVSGDGCWGIPNPNPKPEWLSWLPDWLWAYDYPHNILNEGTLIDACDGKYCHVLATPVFPTPLYETLSMLLIFIILWSLRKRIKIPSLMFAIYLVLGGIERFFVEKIRINNEYNIFGGITQAEIISFFMVLIGTAGIILLIVYRKKIIQIASPIVKDINKPKIKNKTKTEIKDKITE